MEKEGILVLVPVGVLVAVAVADKLYVALETGFPALLRVTGAPSGLR